MIEWIAGVIGVLALAVGALWRRNATLGQKLDTAEKTAQTAQQGAADRTERIKTNETARTADVDVIKSHDSMRHRQRD